MATPVKKLYANPKHHDLARAFVLIKPTRPFYIEGEDYSVREAFTEKVLTNAKLVIKLTCELDDIPENYAYLCRDLSLERLKQVLRNHNKETTYDILVFSSNAYYNKFYSDKTEQATASREELFVNPDLFTPCS